MYGNISFGLEKTNGKIKNEIILSSKSFESLFNKYFRGIGARYFFKYSFVNKRNFNLTLDAGFLYRFSEYSSQKNKWYRYSYLNFNDKADDPIFLMGENKNEFGFSLGSTFNFYISKNILIGASIGGEYVYLKHKFIVNEFVSGIKPIDLVSLPYEEVLYRKYFYPYILLKIGYEL
jgi:hypothetical protein